RLTAQREKDPGDPYAPQNTGRTDLPAPLLSGTTAERPSDPLEHPFPAGRAFQGHTGHIGFPAPRMRSASGRPHLHPWEPPLPGGAISQGDIERADLHPGPHVPAIGQRRRDRGAVLSPRDTTFPT